MLMESLIVISITLITLFMFVYFSNIIFDEDEKYELLSRSSCSTIENRSGFGNQEDSFECSELRQDYKNSKLYRHIFLLVVASLLIISGFTLIKTNYINAGFTSAGVLLLLYTVMSYWQNYGDKQKVFVLFVGLVGVVAGGSYYLNKHKEKVIPNTFE